MADLDGEERLRQRNLLKTLLQNRTLLQNFTVPDFNASLKKVNVQWKSPEIKMVTLKLTIQETKKPGNDYLKVLALGKRLMKPLSILLLDPAFTVNTLVDLEMARPDEKPFLTVKNLQLQCGWEIHKHITNETVMDGIALDTILAWEKWNSTEFMLHITIRY